ncbi:MAG: division/cell wall cluster transcriptional repressor MraZ [Capsulimonadaceae bacterium]|nr:division/cell wall cluster transcriptional repressor MraZ [Capsulimonadaceae bacterium]
MYWGGFEHTVDDKGRVIIPSKFRPQLGEKFIITKGLDHCLFVLTEEDFRTFFDEKFKAQPFLDKNSIMLQRFFCAEAIDANLDNQGRVALSPHLRDWAMIETQSDVSIVGMTNHVEIWNKKRWSEFVRGISEESLMASAEATGVGKGLFHA